MSGGGPPGGPSSGLPGKPPPDRVGDPGGPGEALGLPGFAADPYRVHARLRGVSGLAWSAPWGAHVASRYADVVEALRQDGDTLSAVGQTSAALAHLGADDRSGLAAIERLFATGLLWSDPPDHGRIRGVVNTALNPRDLERLRPDVRAIVADVVTSLPSRGAIEIVGSFASVIPIRVLARLLGLPATMVPRVTRWADTLAEFMGCPHPTVEQGRAAQVAVLAARTEVEELIAGRDRSNGVIGRLAALRAGGAELSEDELHATLIVLLVGGHRTTAAGIALSILALARDSILRRALRADPDLMPVAVEEFLRHESPHQRTVRIVRRPTSVAGTALHPGEVLVLLNGAANRDAARFPMADTLVPDRRPSRHLAFSSGIHFCMGAALARAELVDSLRAFLDRFPDVELVREPEWLDNHTLRTPTSLWVEVRSA